MNENKLLAALPKLFHQDSDLAVGPGDDCALIKFGGKYLLAAADQLIQDVHYFPDTPPEAVAAKLLKRNLSDIAAMGGIPRWAICTLACNGCSDEFFMRFFNALEACAKKYQCAIAGGDLAELPTSGTVATLTILGEVELEKVCLRSNARPGELIFVTGQLGDTLYSQHHLEFEPRLAEGRFLSENAFSCCMMDISDGLAADLPRLLERSSCGAHIQLDKLPCRNNCSWQSAIADGEDYELLFTTSADRAGKLLEVWPFDTPLSCIGQITADAGTVRYYQDAEEITLNGVNGYEHFRA